MASLSERRNSNGPDRTRGILTRRIHRSLEVQEGEQIDRNNGHIVVKLAGEGAREYGMKEPVILYQRDKST